MEKLRRMDTDKCLFLFGNIFLIIGIIVGIIVVVAHIPLGTGEDCSFHRFTGLYCLGCGGTRAMLAFLKGDILTSMRYHVFTTYSLVWYILFMGSHYVSLITKGRIKGMRFRLRYIIIGVILLVGHFVIRNLMLVKYGSILWPMG